MDGTSTCDSPTTTDVGEYLIVECDGRVFDRDAAEIDYLQITLSEHRWGAAPVSPVHQLPASKSHGCG